MRALGSFFYRFAIAAELLSFFWRRRRFYLIPLVVVLLLLASFLVASQGSGIGPFIYAIF
ncbi:MAG: hypothetical protein HY685_06935 [Chloroflexi bacterium]|nr:hypothetical protein [Chloroflexota bacterium]